MSQELHVLLTNDDGIDAPGLRALHGALDDIASVTVVAPMDDQSGAGRSLTYGRIDTADVRVDAVDIQAEKFSCAVPHREHELGYAIEGTPCDCVIVGVNALDPPPDVVVSGCNPGVNLGTHVFSRSGTVSAAYEAACLGVPAMAVSVDKLGFDGSFEPAHFEPTATLATRLLEHAVSKDLFSDVDYLNLNSPRPDREPGAVELTEPTDSYELHAHVEDGQFRLVNRFWERISTSNPLDPPGTDRRAVQEDNISVSPLRLPFSPAFPPELAAFVDDMDTASL